MDENREDQPLSSEELLRRAREGLGEADGAAETPADFDIESYPPPSASDSAIEDTDVTPAYAAEEPSFSPEPPTVPPEPPTTSYEPPVSRDEPESALAAADRFIKLYPRHPHIDYMFYLKGLVNFDAGKDLISQYLPQDPTQRDPGTARAAFDDFGILVRKYPTSKYAKDSRQRMVFLRNNLAAYEVTVAEYYMRREAYVAAQRLYELFSKPPKQKPRPLPSQSMAASCAPDAEINVIRLPLKSRSLLPSPV